MPMRRSSSGGHTCSSIAALSPPQRKRTCKPDKDVARLDDMSDDVLRMIIGHVLDAAVVTRLAACCTRMRDVCLVNAIWRPVVTARWPNLPARLVTALARVGPAAMKTFFLSHRDFKGLTPLLPCCLDSHDAMFAASRPLQLADRSPVVEMVAVADQIIVRSML
jgi:hypothetical protein